MKVKTWRDTVITFKQYLEMHQIVYYPEHHPDHAHTGYLCKLTEMKAQARISFKVGQEEERKRFKELCAQCDTPLIKVGKPFSEV